ncbi:MAG: hypothetical protein COA94_04925 [Rickettsiales bacterium]|nr:MAG: hypothetical protein COA94_04925 [Rickettsiales bacterium]
MSKKNWNDLVSKYDKLIGGEYTDDEGMLFTFVGLIHSDDDFYYGLIPKGGSEKGMLIRLSCVCALESFGYDRI